MTPKPPTPQAISALLRKAGYGRSEFGRNAAFSSSGYRVSKDHGNDKAVRVRHVLGGVAHPDDMDRARDKRAQYAETITAAGWTVESGEYELTVTAKPESPEGSTHG